MLLRNVEDGYLVTTQDMTIFKNWHQTSLPTDLLQLFKKMGYNIPRRQYRETNLEQLIAICVRVKLYADFCH